MYYEGSIYCFLLAQIVRCLNLFFPPVTPTNFWIKMADLGSGWLSDFLASLSPLWTLVQIPP